MSRCLPLVVALLGCGLLADAALGATRISGRLSDPSYDVIVVERNGRTKAVSPAKSGAFQLRVSSAKGASLHLIRDGRYSGPVVLRASKRIALAGGPSVRLGTVRVRGSYATTSRRVQGSGPKIRTNASGRPVGAGKLGLVRVRGALRVRATDVTTEGTDADLDGVPNAFDADNDGDLTLDSVEGAEQSGPQLDVSATLPTELFDTINANAGTDPDREEIFKRQMRMLFVFPADQAPGQQRVGVTCPFTWCAGAHLVNESGHSQQTTTPWPDADGDSLRDLVLDGPSFNRQVFPRASTTEIKPGDAFTATTDTGVSATTALSFIFTSSVAAKSIGSHTFSYPANRESPGTPGHPVKIPRKVQITLWRPQRAAIPGAETGGLRDVGGLHYGVDVNGAFCRAGDFTELSSTLKPGFAEQAPLQDTAPDAPPSGDTISFTVDTAACERNGGGSTGGGGSMVSIRAQDAAMDGTVQHITVEFE